MNENEIFWERVGKGVAASSQDGDKGNLIEMLDLKYIFHIF
jgi:hypothetical protein